MSSLLRVNVRFQTGNGNEIESEVLYYDSMPEGSSFGTLFALHGTPGTHAEFRRLGSLLDKRIRLITPNFPGYGITKGHPSLCYDNVERQNFIHAFIDKIGIKGRLIVIGHSRGAENALMTAVQRNAYGLIIVNGTGFRYHHPVRPIWRFRLIAAIYDYMRPLRPILDPYYKHWFETSFKFVAKRPALVPRFLKTVANLSLDKTRPFIERARNSPMKILYLHAGNDYLIENDIQEEIVREYSLREMSVDQVDESFIVDVIEDSFAFQGKGCAICFENESHFVHIKQASILAQAVRIMFEANHPKRYSHL